MKQMVYLGINTVSESKNVKLCVDYTQIKKANSKILIIFKIKKNVKNEDSCSLLLFSKSKISIFDHWV